MSDYDFITYETFDDGAIARIMLNRPEARNAQNRGMLVELDAAFGVAEADDDVRVVILGGEGPMFSAGHDMGSSSTAFCALTRARAIISRGTDGQSSESAMLQECVGTQLYSSARPE